MSARYMLDSDIASYAIRGQGNAGNAILSRPRAAVCISAIAVAELRYGIERSPATSYRAQVDAFVGGMDIVPFDGAAAHEYGVIRAALEQAGRTIGHNDMLLAAHALSLGATFVTNNVRHFERVPNLTLENWL